MGSLTHLHSTLSVKFDAPPCKCFRRAGRARISGGRCNPLGQRQIPGQDLWPSRVQVQARGGHFPGRFNRRIEHHRKRGHFIRLPAAVRGHLPGGSRSPEDNDLRARRQRRGRRGQGQGHRGQVGPVQKGL